MEAALSQTGVKTVKKPDKLTKEVSVMAWIEDQFGNILLLKQVAGAKLWTLPGGKVRRRESLTEALARELREETGLRMRSCKLIHFFDRSEKSNITFLFRVTIKGKDIVYPREKEIETALYTDVLPKQATPSLNFFWAYLRGR